MRWPNIICVLSGLSVFPTPASADESDVATVSIDRIESHNTCYDDWCNGPDYFVRVRLQNPSVTLDCGVTQVSVNLENVTNVGTLCGASVGKIRKPYSVLVELFDADGPGNPPSTSDADQMNIGGAARLDAVVGPFTSPNPSTRQVVIQGPQAWVTITVDAVPEPSTFLGFSVTPAKVDPSLGETFTIRGGLSDPTPLTITAIPPGGAGPIPIAQLTPAGPFAVTWDGTDLGTPLPNGVYTIIATGRSAAAAPQSAAVELDTSRLLTFRNPRLDTPERLNAHAIFPAVAFSVAEPVDAELLVLRRRRSICDPTVFHSVTFPGLARGSHRVEWNGRDIAGAWAPAGDYCLVLRGTRPGTRATFAGGTWFPIVLEDPPPLFVDVRLSPEVPALQPGGRVDVVARVRDDLAQPRPARTIRLFASAFSPGQTASLPLIGVCTGADTCAFKLPNQITGTAAIRALASDDNNELLKSTTIRLVDLVAPSSRDIRVSVPATQDGRLLFEVSRSRTVDVAFHRSVDFLDLDTNTAPSFSGAVGASIDAMLFGASKPSLIESNMALTAFWAVMAPASVQHTSSPTNGATNLCRVVGAAWSGSADVDAVLHRTDCRDNAPSGFYTAKTPRIGWHEIHHQPFGLWDEYCCDGGYSYQSLPNVYPSMGQCSAGATDPSTCHQIQKVVGTATVTVPWFAGDPPGNDVMVDFGEQNGDDRRRVNYLYSLCSAGGC